MGDLVEAAVGEDGADGFAVGSGAALEGVDDGEGGLAFAEVAGYRFAEDVFGGGEVEHVVDDLEGEAGFLAEGAEALNPHLRVELWGTRICAEGIEATMGVLQMFMGMCDALEFEIHHLASDGSTVLTERTDTFTMNGKSAPLPVMGAFQVLDGKITAWRDYFDMAQVTAMLGGG